MFASDDSAYTLPIEWQKVELQKQIEEKLNTSLTAIIPSQKYLLNINITLGAVKTIGVGGGKPTSNQNFPLAKLGLNKNSAAYKNAIATGVDSIFTRINGVAVDLILDNKITRNQEAQVKNFISQTVKSYTEKIPSVKVTRAVLLQEDTLQKDLQVAQVNVQAAQALAEAITKSNDKIAQAIAATQGVKLPEENKTETKNEDKTKQALPETWQEWVIAMKIPIGIVIATMLLMMAINGFKRFESQKVALMAQANATAAQAAQTPQESNEVVEEKVEEDKTQNSDGLAAFTSSSGDTGFSQFKRMAEQYPETAAYLVKLWLNMNTKESNEALAVLPKMIPVESLVGVFGSLEDKLKSQLKKTSNINIDAATVARADGFIVSQMVDTFLVNTIVLPDELKMVLSEMSMEECVECYRRDNRLGAAFINVLQTAQLGKLFSLLSDEEVTALFQDGLSFNADNVQYLADTLPGLLESIRADKQKVRVPLLDKAMDLIKELGVEKESQVFDMLIASGDSDQVIEATQKFFPSELILKMPPEKMRTLINRFPTKERATLIFSRPQDEQNLFFAAIGESGRLRDIINSELAEIQKNDKLKNQIIKDQSKIWQKFVTTSRDAIRKDSSIKEAADVLLEQWLQEKGVSYSGGENASSAA